MNTSRINSENVDMTQTLTGRVSTSDELTQAIRDYGDSEELQPAHEMDFGEAPQPVADEMSPNQIRKISIEQLNYGYIVKIGCHSFAIESYGRVTTLLNQYMANPQKVEQSWFRNEFTLKRNTTLD